MLLFQVDIALHTHNITLLNSIKNGYTFGTVNIIGRRKIYKFLLGHYVTGGLLRLHNKFPHVELNVQMLNI